MSLEAIRALPFRDQIKAYEEFYGRTIITPRDYDPGDGVGYSKWYMKAKCRCVCGAEVMLKRHCEHKKSKKHKEYLDKK